MPHPLGGRRIVAQMPGAPRFVIRHVRHDQDAPFALPVNPGQPASAHAADRRALRGRRQAGCSRRARIALQFGGWQVIRLGGWTAGSGRCGWPGPVRPRPLPAGPGTSGSTASGSSPRMPCGPVTRCGCEAKDVNASWSSSRSSPSASAHRLPPHAISTTALPLRPARRPSRWLPATAARAVRPSASAGVSRSCSGGRPAEPVSGCAAKTGLLRRDTAASASGRVFGQLHDDRGSLQCRSMMTFTELAPASSDPPEPFTGRLRLAVAAYLARFKGSSREHTESDLRCRIGAPVKRSLTAYDH